MSATATVTGALASPADAAAAAPERDADLRARARAIHRRVCVADFHTHALFPITHLGWDLGRASPAFRAWNPLRNFYGLIDLPRMIQGGVKALVFVSYVLPRPWRGYARATLRSIDAFRRFLARNEDRIEAAATAAEVERANARGKVAALFAVEGGHALGGDLRTLEPIRAAGAVYLTLTHFVNNDLSGSATHPGRDIGLTARGREAVREMERLGILPDVTHSSARAKRDTVRIARGPVICSHTGLKRFWGAARATSDDEVRAIAGTGGVIGILLSPIFLKGARRATVDAIADNIDHVISLVGPDHVCIGSDFGSGLTPPEGLGDISDYPEITVSLVRRGHDEATIAKVWSGSFLRVLRLVGR
jgi:membrane dipeptidase